MLQLNLGTYLAARESLQPFVVLLADDFLTYEGAGVTSDLIRAFDNSGKAQLSEMQVDGPDISKYGVIDVNKKMGMWGPN